MKTLTIKVPDNKYSFFVELVKNLGFAKQIVVEEEEPAKAEILNGIREAVEEVNLIKQGKKKSVPLKDFLNEL
jgi:hypothetical protein